MKKKIEISMESPCSEDYSKFRSTSIGGYCQKCQKEVIDFTKFKDKDLFSYFDTQSGRVCGKFHPKQLGTISESKKPTFISSRIVAATLGVLSILTVKQAYSQNRITAPYSAHINNINGNKSTSINKETSEPLKEVTGIVIDSTSNSPLPGTTVLIKGTEKGAVSDLSGKFTLQLAEEELSNTILEFSFIGYLSKEILASKIDDSPIVMVEDYDALEETVIVGGACYKRPFPSNIWHWITRPFRK